MLVKKLCKKCINNSAEDIAFQWDSNDEKRWKRSRKVWCPKIGSKGKIIENGEEVPEECPYRLEQMIFGQKKNDFNVVSPLSINKEIRNKNEKISW